MINVCCFVPYKRIKTIKNFEEKRFKIKYPLVEYKNAKFAIKLSECLFANFNDMSTNWGGG